MSNAPSPILRLINRDGKAVDAYTMPPQGSADPDYCIPVVLARGVRPVQRYVPIPALNKANATLFATTIVNVLPDNPTRRYLKIINNGNYSVELWTTIPQFDDAARTDDVLRGEVIFANGYGIIESDTCRLTPVYATSVSGATGLLVMEA